MTSHHRSAANAVSGKTARACDSCLRRRARWYCSADDAFLCQACDSSVHSANPLARRHDRVRLKTSSSCSPPSDLDSALPAWHHGFKRKARTPRHAKGSPAVPRPVFLVPDLQEEDEEELLYCVPILNPVLAEFFSPPPAFDETNPTSTPEEAKPAINHSHGFPGFDPSDAELAEFAADVESLLGNHDSCCIDGLGLLGPSETEDINRVKMEMMDAVYSSGNEIIDGYVPNMDTNFLVDMEMDFSSESLEFNFDCESPTAGDESEEQKAETVDEINNGPMVMGLKLDYDAVIAAWSSCQGCSPWTDGEQPQFNLDHCWPDFMGGMMGSGGGGELHGGHGGMGTAAHVGVGGGGREARVSRYREKRRTRLFSKKIRYEVRKLNAEKRPRIKGRFVKRTSFAAPPTAAVAAVAAGFSYV